MNDATDIKLGMYLYHGTTMENVPLIAKYGLLPRQRGVFGFNSPSAAENWAAVRGETTIEFPEAEKRSGDHRPVVLRFRSADLKRGLRIDREATNSWLTKKSIPPQQVEVRVGNRWVPLQNYGKRSI